MLIIIRYVLAMALGIPAVYMLLYIQASREEPRVAQINTRVDSIYWWCGLVVVGLLVLLVSELLVGHSVFPAVPGSRSPIL